MKLIDAESIVEYIVNNYRNSKKIVEVGVGRYPEIALELRRKMPKTKIIVTDIDPYMLEQISRYHGIKTMLDDLISPNMEIYMHSDLIYAIRPPPEFQYYLLRIVKIVKADLLLRLLTNEHLCIDHPKHEIINYKNTVLHVFKLKHTKSK
ncbi:MAG: UPF0146 family protein [Candidatus Jordarchaeaceae archaeon]